MTIFNSYVSLPEGTPLNVTVGYHGDFRHRSTEEAMAMSCSGLSCMEKTRGGNSHGGFPMFHAMFDDTVGRKTWVCLKMVYTPQKGTFNRGHDDSPMDLEVPYFQTNPHEYIYIPFCNPLSLSVYIYIYTYV